MAACRGDPARQWGGRVKPPKFSYVRAGGLAQVLELLEVHGQEAQILAGGQSLMPALNMRLSATQIAHRYQPDRCAQGHRL